MDKVRIAKEMIFHSNHIVAFTGAGVSTESNIPDFRSSGGIFDRKTGNNIPPERILSRSFFNENPAMFYDFYKNNLIYTTAKPNDCHIALAELEKTGRLQAIITQNIDGLHQKAGSENVIELHGNAYRNYCMKCRKEYGIESMIDSVNVPFCECGGIIRPDVVLYEEALDESDLRKAKRRIESCEVLIVLGTSLVVYPAAGLLKYYSGSKMILINKTSTTYDDMAALVIYDRVGEVMRSIVIDEIRSMKDQ